MKKAKKVKDWYSIHLEELKKDRKRIEKKYKRDTGGYG